MPSWNFVPLSLAKSCFVQPKFICISEINSFAMEGSIFLSPAAHLPLHKVLHLVLEKNLIWVQSFRRFLRWAAKHFALTFVFLSYFLLSLSLATVSIRYLKLIINTFYAFFCVFLFYICMDSSCYSLSKLLPLPSALLNWTVAESWWVFLCW